MDPKAFVAGGQAGRRSHVAEADAKATPAKKPAGRRKAHRPDAKYISCLLDPDVERQLRLLQLDIRVELGLLVSEGLRLAFALPGAEERLRKALGKPSKCEVL